MLRMKTKEEWTEKHRNVTRKLVLEGGWVQQRLFDIGWSDESVKLVTKSTIAQNGTNSDVRSQRLSESGSKKRGPQRRSGSGKKRYCEAFSQVCKSGSLTSTKSWSMPAEGFKGHVATDGSLPGNAGKWGTCASAVVQLDYDEEMGPLHAVYGSMEAELEVQRTIKRAERTAFLCLLKRVIVPIKNAC